MYTTVSDTCGSCRSAGWFRQRIQQYPLTFAFGTLFLVFILPNLLTFGLVGAERTALAILLELEELLAASLFAGAKWVCSVMPLLA